jgi:hypothetical protein
MAGPLLKGALVSFMPGGPLGLPALPNVIVFQFNPETITHAWTEATAPQPPQGTPERPTAHVSALATTGDPGESFSFTLMMDSDQQITNAAQDAVGAGLAFVSGLHSRLAALEMLQFPNKPASGGGLVGGVSAAASAAGLGASASDAAAQGVPPAMVPIVIFVWGPLRILPVRVTALSVTEKLFDAALNPTHAEAQITLTVLTPDDLINIPDTLAGIAKAAYDYTQGVRQIAALANLGESAASVIGMLPSPF